MADNALSSKDIKLILESIEFLTLTDLDLSFNYFGKAVTELLVEMTKTAASCNGAGHLLKSLRRLGLRNTAISFSVAEISRLFELRSLETVDLRGNSCTRQ